ncbi:MAG: hypothetical protein DRN06_07655 [Thermoprotei archaeon]|nr:MAG: hypothetical protein DRN06_07655 [Thermoprotei archaeon]
MGDTARITSGGTRIEKMDELLLFYTALAGLIPYVLQLALGKAFMAYYALPILVYVLITPTYIGYYRGAVKLDLVEERVRGWVYLITGLYDSCVFTIYLWLSDRGHLAHLGWWRQVIYSAILLSSMAVAFLSYENVLNSYYELLGEEISDERRDKADDALFDTIRASGLFSFFVASLTSLLGNIALLQAVVLLLAIALYAILFILGCIFERRARKHIKNIISLVRST